MTNTVISYFSLALLALTTFGVLFAYIKMRGVSNKLLALAGKEFHDKVDSILQTSDELPDVALDYLSMMLNIAKSNRGPWNLLRALRRQAERRSSAKDADLASTLPKLRPELEKLFHEATVMWINWMLNRNVVLGIFISFELRKLALRRNAVDASPKDVENAVFSNLRNAHC